MLKDRQIIQKNEKSVNKATPIETLTKAETISNYIHTINFYNVATIIVNTKNYKIKNIKTKHEKTKFFNKKNG